MFGDELAAWWRTELGACPPIGHRVRVACARRWVRFHLAAAAEHDPIATALLGDGEPIAVIVVAEGDAPPLAAPALAPVPALDDDGVSGRVWAGPARWRAGRFTDVFARVIDGALTDVLLVNPDRRAIYHPDGGGADAIGADLFVCDSLRRDFRAHL